MPRRRSRRRPARRAASRPAPARNPPPPLPYDRVLTHCYHWSGDNEICSIGGFKDFQIGSHLPSEILKDFQIGSHLPSEILKDFQIGRIGSLKDFQMALSRRATDAITVAPNTPGYRRVYGRNKTFDMEERKAFISSGCNHLWQEKFYGIMRVSVYGVDTICVVTRNKDVVQLEKDVGRLRGTLYGMLQTVPKALISEVEDLACPPGESRQADRKRSQKPFGLVSVISGTNKASSDKFDEVKAIEFLQEEMNSASTFTFIKTVKTAICAFQHLFRKKFKPEEIRVVVWKNRVVRKRDNNRTVIIDDTIDTDTDDDDDDTVRKRDNNDTDDDDTSSSEYDVDEIVKELKIRDELSIKDILDGKQHIAAGSGGEGSP